MNDEEFRDRSRYLWGFEGFEVVAVRFEKDQRGETIKIVELETRDSRHTCGDCGRRDVDQAVLAFREGKPRRFRDCSLGDYETYVEVTPWRLFCCGGTRVEAYPWEAQKHRMTRRFFERVAALCTRLPVRQVAALTGLSWDTVARIDSEATRLALGGDQPSLDGLRWIGIDEVSRTGGHVYFTIVTNLQTGRVVFVGDGKGEDALAPFFEQLGARRQRRIRGVVSDLNAGYLASVQRYIPKAMHVLDRFHIVLWLNEALNQLRRRLFGAAPDDDLGRTLKVKKWLLLSAWERLDPEDKRLLRRLCEANTPLFQGHLLKERLRALLQHPWRYLGAFRRNFEAWCRAVEESALPEFLRVARRLTAHLEKIVAGFSAGIPLGLVEATNGKIGMLRRQCKGLRDPEYFKFKIYQRCSLPDNPWATIHL